MPAPPSPRRWLFLGILVDVLTEPGAPVTVAQATLMQFRLAFDQSLDVALGGFNEPGLVIARPYVARQPSAQPETRALPATRAQ